MGRPAKDETWHAAMDTKSEAQPKTDSTVPAGRPTCPRDLSPAAKKKFRELCRQLAARRVLTKGDGELLGMYADLFDRRADALAVVKQEGQMETYEARGKSDQIFIRRKKNPYLALAQETEKQMLAILVQLGLTPLQKDKPKQGGPGGNPAPEPGTMEYLILHGDKK